MDGTINGTFVGKYVVQKIIQLLSFAASACLVVWYCSWLLCYPAEKRLPIQDTAPSEIEGVAPQTTSKRYSSCLLYWSMLSKKELPTLFYQIDTHTEHYTDSSNIIVVLTYVAPLVAFPRLLRSCSEMKTTNPSIHDKSLKFLPYSLFYMYFLYKYDMIVALIDFNSIFCRPCHANVVVFMYSFCFRTMTLLLWWNFTPSYLMAPALLDAWHTLLDSSESPDSLCIRHPPNRQLLSVFIVTSV